MARRRQLGVKTWPLRGVMVHVKCIHLVPREVDCSGTMVLSRQRALHSVPSNGVISVHVWPRRCCHTRRIWWPLRRVAAPCVRRRCLASPSTVVRMAALTTPRSWTSRKACSQDLKLDGQDFGQLHPARISGLLYDRGWFHHPPRRLPVRFRISCWAG